MIGFTFLLLSVIMMISGFYVTRNNRTANLTTRYILILLLWTSYIILISESGVLTNFSFPFIPVLIVIPALAVILIGTSRKSFMTALGSTPVSLPVYIQSFRILVELMIYGAFLENVLPESVTFLGMNYDVLVGVSALVMGFLIQQGRVTSKGLLAWNIISILILMLTIFSFASHFYLSSTGVPASHLRFVRLPYLLLPAVLVPYAIFYHVLSIRQCLWFLKGNEVVR